MEYPIQHYLDVLNKYAVFEGRARRAEYWYFILFNIVISIVLSMISFAIGDVIGIFSLLYSLAVLIPGLAVGVRRLHDIGNSGWMMLVGLIPLIGPIWLLILMATDGNVGTNKYGTDPKSPAIPTPTI
jgi:uncharacterized membrane protein YhaH (DUF805 family)